MKTLTEKQKTHLIESIGQEFNWQLNAAQKNLKDATDRLVEDPSYSFTWVAEDIIKYSYLKNTYSRLIYIVGEELKKEADILEAVDILVKQERRNKNEMFRMVRSSNPFNLLQQNLEMEARCIFLEEMDRLIPGCVRAAEKEAS